MLHANTPQQVYGVKDQFARKIQLVDAPAAEPANTKSGQPSVKWFEPSKSPSFETQPCNAPVQLLTRRSL